MNLNKSVSVLENEPLGSRERGPNWDVKGIMVHECVHNWDQPVPKVRFQELQGHPVMKLDMCWTTRFMQTDDRQRLFLPTVGHHPNPSHHDPVVP